MAVWSTLSVAYSILSFLPTVSYGICLAYGYYEGRFKPPGFPCPSNATLSRVERHIFGSFAVGVVVLLIFVAWKQFLFFRLPATLPRKKEFTLTVLMWAAPITCFLSGLIYGAFAFWNLRDGEVVHRILTTWLFLILDSHFALSDAVFSYVKTLRSIKWGLVYDGILVLPQIPYLIWWTHGFRTRSLTAQLTVSISGYIATALAFGKFAIIGWQTRASRIEKKKGKGN
jgi:hypothetical protein